MSAWPGRPALWVWLTLWPALMVGACGADGDPADAIQNGDTLATSTTHWSSRPCLSTSSGISVAIGGDGLARTIIENTGSGLQSTTWTKLGGAAVLFGAAPGPTAVLGQLQDIAGSLSGGSFSATVVASNGVQGVCTFSLVAGTL